VGEPVEEGRRILDGAGPVGAPVEAHRDGVLDAGLDLVHPRLDDVGRDVHFPVEFLHEQGVVLLPDHLAHGGMPAVPVVEFHRAGHDGDLPDVHGFAAGHALLGPPREVGQHEGARHAVGHDVDGGPGVALLDDVEVGVGDGLAVEVQTEVRLSGARVAVVHEVDVVSLPEHPLDDGFPLGQVEDLGLVDHRGGEVDDLAVRLRSLRQGVVAQGDRVHPGAFDHLVGHVADPAAHEAVGEIPDVEGVVLPQGLDAGASLLEPGPEGHPVATVGVFLHEGHVVDGLLRDEHHERFQQVLHGLEAREPPGVVGELEPPKLLHAVAQQLLALFRRGDLQRDALIEFPVAHEAAAQVVQEPRVGLVDPAVHLGEGVGVAPRPRGDAGLRLDGARQGGFDEMGLPARQGGQGPEEQRLARHGLQQLLVQEKGPDLAPGQLALPGHGRLVPLHVVCRCPADQGQKLAGRYPLSALFLHGTAPCRSA